MESQASLPTWLCVLLRGSKYIQCNPAPRGGAGRGHVILPLQGTGGSRCSVKPASRGPPLSKVHDTCWRKPPTPPFDGGPCTNSLLGAGLGSKMNLTK